MSSCSSRVLCCLLCFFFSVFHVATAPPLPAVHVHCLREEKEGGDPKYVGEGRKEGGRFFPFFLPLIRLCDVKTPYCVGGTTNIDNLEGWVKHQLK